MLRERSMIKKLLAMLGLLSVDKVASQPVANPAHEALMWAIAEQSKNDPLIGAKIGSKELTQRLLSALKSERGVHVESLLCALGALAGYACQASVRSDGVAQGLKEKEIFMVVGTASGKHYFFGDKLNAPLAESKLSVWSISGGGAQKAGCEILPDVSEIFKHVTDSIGKESFGKPRVPSKHVAAELPIVYVQTLWPLVLPLLTEFCKKPEHWPILVSLSIQEVISMGKGVVEPCLALTLVMESAVPMSKVNLNAP
jgi:hypothetical protein